MGANDSRERGRKVSDVWCLVSWHAEKCFFYWFSFKCICVVTSTMNIPGVCVGLPMKKQIIHKKKNKKKDANYSQSLKLVIPTLSKLLACTCNVSVVVFWYQFLLTKSRLLWHKMHLRLQFFARFAYITSYRSCVLLRHNHTMWRWVEDITLTTKCPQFVVVVF